MPGYLFYPSEDVTELPDTVPENHLSGKWCYATDLSPKDTSLWVQLNKPHWMSPWNQKERPRADAAQTTIQWVETEGIPALFAKMAWQAELSCWVEAERWFVVPGNWPQSRH